MKSIIVLCAGMVGRVIASDLAKEYDLTAADISPAALQRLKDKGIKTIQADLSNTQSLKKLIQSYNLVVSAVPGFMGFETLKSVIEAGKNAVDISFFSENALELSALAKRKKVTALIDFGLAPGMDNLILGYHNERMEITDFECLVGGLPKIRKMPFNYKAPFSPADVIEEYIRPARFVENGKQVVKPALSDIEHIYIEEVGTLESFNSDGLRTLLHTMPHVPNMIEKTLRYPGHAQMIMALRDAGFFSKQGITMGEQTVIPIEFTSRILFNEWELEDGEEELTVMRITLKGKEKGQPKEINYTLFDEYDKKTGITSMARTTGYTATAGVNLLLEGMVKDAGVIPPEMVGKDEKCFRFILNYLRERNVHYKKSINESE